MGLNPSLTITLLPASTNADINLLLYENVSGSKIYGRCRSSGEVDNLRGKFA